MIKSISFIIFLFIGAHAFANCTTSVISDPVLGDVYFKVQLEKSDKRTIFVDAFNKDGLKVKSYKGYPAYKSDISNGLQWTAENVYAIGDAGQEVKLEKARLGILKFNNTGWLSLLFSLNGGIIDPAICD